MVDVFFTRQCYTTATAPHSDQIFKRHLLNKHYTILGTHVVQHQRCVFVIGGEISCWDRKGDKHTHTHKESLSAEWRVGEGCHAPRGVQPPCEMGAATVSGCNRPHPPLSSLWWAIPALLCSQSMDGAQFQTPHHAVDNAYSWLCRFIQARETTVTSPFSNHKVVTAS